MFRLSLKPGEATLDTQNNPGDVVGWDTDTKFRVRIAQRRPPTAAPRSATAPTRRAPWKKLVRWSSDDSTAASSASPRTIGRCGCCRARAATPCR
ncbi:MAG: hypothetical protein U0736_14415 [Gemmataceae bacterium]